MYTVPYVSPELRSNASAGTPSDIYSLGVMLLEVYTGQVPSPPANGPFRVSSTWTIYSLLEIVTGKSTTGMLCQQPSRRPLAPEVVKKLELLVSGRSLPALAGVLK